MTITKWDVAWAVAFSLLFLALLAFAEVFVVPAAHAVFTNCGEGYWAFCGAKEMPNGPVDTMFGATCYCIPNGCEPAGAYRRYVCRNGSGGWV